MMESEFVVMGLLRTSTGSSGVVMGYMGMPLTPDMSLDIRGCCLISYIGGQGIPLMAACAKTRKKIRKRMMIAIKLTSIISKEVIWALGVMFGVNVVELKRDARPSGTAV